MAPESMMYVSVGTCWIAGTVYLGLDPEAEGLGTRPLGGVGSEDFAVVRGGMKRRGREGKGIEVKKEKQKKADITHSPFSAGSISGNSRKIVR